MTADQARQLAQIYINHLTARKVPALQEGGQLAHAHWMCLEVLRIEPEKVNRWLGFIQGVLWCEGEFTIDQLRDQTREVLTR